MEERSRLAELSYDEVLAALQQLEERDKLTPFTVGDILAFQLEDAPGKGGTALLKRVAGDLGRSLSWVAQREMVAVAFPPPLRVELWGGQEPPPPVTWVHHRIVVYACHEPEDMQRWIKVAIEQQLSTRQLTEAIKGERPDSTDDIIITHDQVAGEVHVLLSGRIAEHVAASSTPGVLTVADGDGATTAIHLRLPEAAMGRKARLRRVR